MFDGGFFCNFYGGVKVGPEGSGIREALGSDPARGSVEIDGLGAAAFPQTCVEVRPVVGFG